MPKIKKFVPKEDEPAKPTIKEKAPDTAFMVWLRGKQTSHAVHVDVAKDYILGGAPYFGDSTFDAKEAIKERGGTWCANPDKRKDCEDKSIRRGWWSANTEAALLKLLRLPNDDRNRQQWTPLGMGSTQINLLLSWLDEFYCNTVQEEAGDHGPLDKVAKRQRTNGKPDPTPQWIIDYNAKYVHIWQHDTTCIACGKLVTDQFLDCGCGPEVKWQRCAKCGEKYRTDFKKGSIRNANAWCACG